MGGAWAWIPLAVVAVTAAAEVAPPPATPPPARRASLLAWLRRTEAEVAGRRDTAPGASTRVTCSATSLRPGQPLRIDLELRAPEGAASDLYVGVMLPDGRAALFGPDRRPLPPRRVVRLRRSLRLQDVSPGLVLRMPGFFALTVPAVTAPGTYHVFAVLARAQPGGGERVKPADVLAVSLAPFTVAR